jgi:hypothetical protein
MGKLLKLKLVALIRHALRTALLRQRQMRCTPLGRLQSS